MNKAPSYESEKPLYSCRATAGHYAEQDNENPACRAKPTKGKLKIYKDRIEFEDISIQIKDINEAFLYNNVKHFALVKALQLHTKYDGIIIFRMQIFSKIKKHLPFYVETDVHVKNRKKFIFFLILFVVAKFVLKKFLK